MINQILEKYTTLISQLDSSCAEVCKNLPQIPCFPSCSDKVICCKQIFPLSFIEAYYISEGFKKLDRPTRRNLEREAKKLAPMINKKLIENNIARLYKNTDYDTHNAAQQSITRLLHSLKINCPFLSESLCQIYPHRGIDCRLHGLAFDKNTNEILGCYKHKEIFPAGKQSAQFAAHSLPHNHLYKEKISLDTEAIITLANNPIYKHLRYLASPFTPILKDFTSFDWYKFFNENLPTQDITPSTYSLIFDL